MSYYIIGAVLLLVGMSFIVRSYLIRKKAEAEAIAFVATLFGYVVDGALKSKNGGGTKR